MTLSESRSSGTCGSLLSTRRLGDRGAPANRAVRGAPGQQVKRADFLSERLHASRQVGQVG